MNICRTNLGKASLNYNYKWQHGKTILTPTHMENDFIDVTNGNDVLNFINHFSKQHNLIGLNSLKRVEDLLHHHLPINLNNRKDITTWIRKHWDTQFYKNAR